MLAFQTALLRELAARESLVKFGASGVTRIANGGIGTAPFS